MTTPNATRPATGWIPDDEDSFAARLMAVRRRMKWGNASEAGRACGLPAENWRLWEQGRMPSRYVTICMQIASRTGCDLDWLLRGGRDLTITEPPSAGITNQYGQGHPLATRVPVRRKRSADVGPSLSSGRPVSATRPVRRSDPRRALTPAMA